jgi:hypothetical protein
MNAKVKSSTPLGRQCNCHPNLKWFWFCSILALLFLAGCETKDDSKPSGQQKAQPLANNFVNMDQGDSPSRANTPKPPPPVAPKPVETVQPSANNPATASSTQPPPPPAPFVAPQTPDTNQKEAQVGVGKKGRGYGLGVVATPAASLFAAKERIVFEIEIPEAMKLFKAMNDNKGPKSHDEFMEKIIKENRIKLPELPEGDRYQYDPKTEQLMVQSPKKE